MIQEEDILSQLINGIRYLDIRVGYYPNTDEKWYLNHGVINIRPLRDVLEDVQTFMENTNEIVILDFHEFPIGMYTHTVDNKNTCGISLFCGPKHRDCMKKIQSYPILQSLCHTRILFITQIS